MCSKRYIDWNVIFSLKTEISIYIFFRYNPLFVFVDSNISFVDISLERFLSVLSSLGTSAKRNNCAKLFHYSKDANCHATELNLKRFSVIILLR